jgi:single-strand DNA-binding protein
MRTLNKVFMMGYLGNDPELRTTKNGHNYTHLQMAIKRGTRGAEGQPETKTDWHRVHVWGKQGELCAKYLKKGSPVLVEGHLRLFEETLDGAAPVKKVAIHADEVGFLPSSRDRVS